MKKLHAFVLMAGPRNVTTTALELAGFGTVSAGIGMIYGPAGWISGGLSALIVGFLAGRK